MDVEISACSERTPAEIIAQDGERAFRDLESEVLCERISMRQGEIIATGGGAILRAENVRMLKQNGRLYWLDRPLEKLIPTEDRPLSSSREALERRYRERYAIDRGAADVTVSDPATAEAAAKRIREELEA